MADFVKFNKFSLQLGQEKYNFSSDTLKFALANTTPTTAMAVTADLTKPSFSITDLYLSKVASPGDSVDIILLFNQVSYCEPSFVTINTPSEYPD